MKNYKSYLRKRPEYSDMINEVEVGPKDIKYPDRTATIMRNSHYLSRFDGDQSFINLEEQENNIAKEQLFQQEVKDLTRKTNATRKMVDLKSTQRKFRFDSPPMEDTYMEENFPAMDVEQSRRKKVTNDKFLKTRRYLKQYLAKEVDTNPDLAEYFDIADDNSMPDDEDYDSPVGSDIDVDDTEIQNRTDKRKRETEEMKEKKQKVKYEKKPIVKEEGKTVKKGIKKDKTLTKQKDDDDIQILGLNINRNADMDFWNEASAREMRSQLNLRFPGKVGDWAFKTRLQLLNIIKDKIKKGQW